MDLYERLKMYSDSNACRFHMPGHSGTDIDVNTGMDITELSFSDNLLSSDGIISDAEKKIAEVYNSRHCLILTCGATSGIAIAVNTAKAFGNNLIVVGDAHSSVYANASIQGMNVICLNKPQDITDLAINNIGGIIVTTPDYYGNTYGIEQWRNKGCLLIVDESHGAHFPFSSRLPSSLACECDILISSWHKTLPVLTGGSVIICNNDELYNRLQFSRRLIHSTSPNYMIMASMDKARKIMKEQGEYLYDEVLNAIDRFSLLLPEKYKISENNDRTRLVLELDGLNANVIAKELELHNIYCEMSLEDKLVFIVTPYNYNQLPRLAEALKNIKCDAEYKKYVMPKSKKAIKIGSKLDFVKLSEANNLVSAAELGLYPPGVPLIKTGEILSNDIINFLTENLKNVFGLINGLVAVYTEEK